MKKLILSVLLTGFLSTFSYAQSSFLEKGQSGFLVSGLSSENQDYSGYSGEIGYSFSGVFDLGLSVGNYGYNESYLWDELEVTIISPFLSYIILKQDASTPLSISLNGSYDKHIYKENYLNSEFSSVTGDYVTFGTSLFTKIEVFNALNIQPNIGFRYTSGKLQFEDAPGGVETRIHDIATLDLGTSLILNMASNYLFVLSPEMSIQKDRTHLGLSVSFFLPSK